MTDTNPAVGGLSTEERGGLLIALDCAVEGGTLTHDAAMRVLGIVDNHPAAEREVARVTAAVDEHLPHEWRDDVSLADMWWAIAKLRAALSSADTTALDDLLDRERAKARAEALRDAADAWEAEPQIARVVIVHRWLRDRAAAVSPEGGGA